MSREAVGKGSSRKRWVYAILAAVVIATGLTVRAPWAPLSPFVAKYAGGLLYAVMMFLLAAWVLKSYSTRTVALAALALCWGTEFSQLVHAPWLDELRGTWLGHMVLGSWFSWWDVLTYAVGVLVAALAESCS